jgi:hypothetical protein
LADVMADCAAVVSRYPVRVAAAELMLQSERPQPRIDGSWGQEDPPWPARSISFTSSGQ